MNTQQQQASREPGFLETHSLVMRQPAGIKEFQAEQEAGITAAWDAGCFRDMKPDAVCKTKTTQQP